MLAVAAYLPALFNGFAWDDRPLIVENDSLVRPGALTRAFTQDFWESEEQVGTSDYYRPLVTLSYLLNRHAFGLRPAGYHATNILIHAAVSALLLLLLANLGMALPQAFWGAALFAAHPALVESVAWISGRTDSLSVLFVIAFLLADRRRERPGWRIGASMALAVALLSKETAVVAPALAIVLDFVPRRTPALAPHVTSRIGPRGASPDQGPLQAGRMSRLRTSVHRLTASARSRLELVALLLGYAALRWAVLGTAASSFSGWRSGLEASTRLAALPHVVGLLVLPAFSRIEYGEGLPAGPLLPAAAAGLALAALLALAARRTPPRERGAIRSAREQDGPGLTGGVPRRDGPVLLRALLACAGLAMAPSVAVIVLKSVVADRLLYFPAAFLLPACVVALGGATWIGHASPRRRAVPRAQLPGSPAASRRRGDASIPDGTVTLSDRPFPRLLRRVTGAMAVLAVAACAVTTARRTRLWRSDRTLFETAIAQSHPSARSFLNLGIAYHDDGWLSESEEALQAALSRSNLKSAHYTLGLLYTEIGCADLAEPEYEKALVLDPGYFPAANNLGALLAETGRADEAEKVLASALARGRGDAGDLRANFASLRSLLIERRRPLQSPEPTQTSRLVNSRSPRNPHALVAPACGGSEEARTQLRDARVLNRRALELLRVRRLDQAWIMVQAALHRDPKLTAARLNLAQWYVLKHESGRSREILEEILRAEPENEAARRLMGYVTN